jgi:hypothetical protein
MSCAVIIRGGVAEAGRSRQRGKGRSAGGEIVWALTLGRCEAAGPC